MPFLADAPTKKTGFVPDPVIGEVENPMALAPSAEDRLREQEAIGVRNTVRREKERFVRNNVQPGVPLDIEAELPASTRARLSFEGNIDKQVEQLAKKEGILGARKSKDGKNVIVRVPGDDGKPRELLLHPFGALSAGEVAGATAPILKAGVATGTALATGGMSLPVTAGILGASAGANEALFSGGSRLLAGQDIDPSELALASGKEAAINAALPLAGAVVSRGASGIRNALVKGSGDLERMVPSAARRLGVDTTLAETTGSPALASIGRLTAKEEAERQARLGMAKDRAIGISGPSTVLSEEDIANKVQPIFAEASESAQKGVRTAMTDAERAAQAQIQAELDSGLIPTTRTTSEVGDFIRNKIASKSPTSKKTELQAGAEKLYGAANKMAEEEGIVVAPKAISKLASEIDNDTHKALVELVPGIKKIPALNRSLTEETVKDTGLLDAAGRPITNITPPEPLTVSQARALRSVIYEAAHSPVPGEGGVPKRYLSELYHALDEDLKSAVKSGSKELQQAHAAADDFYKSKIQPLQQSDVAKLFLETDAAGRMGGDEIVKRLFRGEGNLDALRAYRNVLGKDSPEWKLLVRQGLQTVVDDAGAITGRIDAGKFLTRLEQLSKSELADEVFGPLVKTLRSDAKLMARAQGTKIPVDELEDALAAAPARVSKLLESAIAREEATNRAYNSAIQKQLRDGTLDPRTIGKVDDFVTRFVENAAVSDVRQALTQIAAKSPTAVEDIRQRVMTNILQSARAKPPLGRTTTGEIEDMDFSKLMTFLEGTERAKYKTILGENGIRFLDDLAVYAEATAKRLAGEQGRRVAPETVAKEVGSAALGFKRNAIGALVDIGTASARKLGGASLVRNPAVRQFLETGKLPSFDAVVGGPTNARGGAILRAPIFAAPQVIEAKKALTDRK